MKPFMSPLLAVVLLGGCQTTSNVSQADKDLATRLTAKYCVLSWGWGISVTRSEIMDEQFTFYSVTRSKERWVRFDMSYQSVRFNTYFNEISRKVICGSRSWNNANYAFTPIDAKFKKIKAAPPLIEPSEVMNRECDIASRAYPVFQNRTQHVFAFVSKGDLCAYGWGHDANVTAATKAALTACNLKAKGKLPGKHCLVYTPIKVQSGVFRRYITLSWQGEPQFSYGTMHLRPGRGGGTFALVKGTDFCFGHYSKTEQGGELWDLDCSNGRRRSGTYSPKGTGKGSVGKGKDDLGRPVTYEIAGS